MKLKLDENLGELGRRALEEAGHDVCTVLAQALQSATDREVIARCVADGRALVTLDLDFSNPLVFPPHQHAGVAVLRLPRKATRADFSEKCSRVFEHVYETIYETGLDCRAGARRRAVTRRT